MLLIDRYILIRFFVNFCILFSLLFVFAATIDLILNLDRFVDTAQDHVGDDAGMLMLTIELVRLIADFELPRIFQFYAFLHGIVGIGAMAFTLSLMHKHKELVAIMASGVSLHRIAMPFLFAIFVLSFVQLINQEMLLPRVAPLLLRGHGQIGQPSVNEFEVLLTPDSAGNLMQSPSFDPATNTLQSPTILKRNERGLTTHRITASEAVWDARQNGWRLRDGLVVSVRAEQDDRTGGLLLQQPIELYQTDLDPRVLLVHRHGDFATMLSLRQISDMLATEGVADTRSLLRHRYTRFASVLVNLLVMGLTLPCFLLREPANLLRQSLLCAALTLPAMLGAAIGMMADLPGIPPAASVFLPVIILSFVAIVPWTNFKT